MARNVRKKSNQGPWWSTWLGVAGVGLVTLAMVAPGSAIVVLYALITGPESFAADAQLTGAPGPLARLGYVLLGVVFLVLPVLAMNFARRRWLGYLLLSLGIAAVVCLWGLWVLQIV